MAKRHQFQAFKVMHTAYTPFFFLFRVSACHDVFQHDFLSACTPACLFPCFSWYTVHSRQSFLHFKLFIFASQSSLQRDKAHTQFDRFSLEYFQRYACACACVR